MSRLAAGGSAHTHTRKKSDFKDPFTNVTAYHLLHDKDQLTVAPLQVLAAQRGAARLQHLVRTALDALIGADRGQLDEAPLQLFAVLEAAATLAEQLAEFLWIACSKQRVTS